MSAAVERLDAFDRFGVKVAEAVNPIVVKEVRQGLRTRTFWFFFSLMLFACVCISLVAFATAESSDDQGRFVFFAFYVCLGIVQFFVIPYSGYRSMAREREEETWVLLTLTGLGPKRILRGKMGSYLLQGALYSSAAAPFLLFSYYLNGIDLFTILTALASGFAYQLFLTSVAVSAATLAESRVMRGLIHFMLLGFLFWGLVTGLSSSFGILEAMRSAGVSTGVAWVSAGSTVFVLGTWGILLYEAAAARMALPTEDYAKGPRLAFLVQVLGGMTLFALGAGASSEKWLAPIGVISTSVHVALVGLFIASDRDGMARSLWLKRSGFSLLRPGALRGFQLVAVLLLVLPLGGVAVAMAGRAPAASDLEEQLSLVVGAPAYALLYLSLPILLSRMLPHGPAQTPALVRVLFLGIFVLASGVPPLVAVLVGADANGALINLLNPVVGLVNLGDNQTDRAMHLLVVWTAALALAFAAWKVLRDRDNPPQTAAR